MPPKKKNHSSGKKKKKNKKTTRSQTTTSTSSIITNPVQFQINNNNSNPNISIPYPPPSFFLDDSDSDDYDFFNPYYDAHQDYSYDDIDDYSNPFHPDHHNFIQEEDKKKAFTFQVVEDLRIFESSKTLMKLPLDVFLDIFSRLPIKPLAVCRCVCKIWGTIIHHKRFTNLHHLKLTQEMHNPFKQSSLLFHVSDGLLEELEIDDEDNKQVFSEIFLLECDKEEGVEKGVLVNPQFMPPKTEHLRCDDLRFEVVGSCNGLMCLGDASSRDPMYVCNPVIGEYMTLPTTVMKMDFGNVSGVESISGFGFDCGANEYKVLKLVFSFCDFTNGSDMTAEVCTLGSNIWRKLGCFKYPVFKNSSQVFVSGALHWTTFVYRELIIAFDVGKEEFNVIPPPPGFIPATPDCEDDELHLGELGGLLRFFSYSSDDQCEVWTMKEYGVKESWTKDFVISRKVWGLKEVHFKPLKLMRNGNILLVIDNQAVSCYDPRRKRFNKLKIRLPRRFDATTHVESFISVRDFVEPTICKPRANTGEWYGIMTSVTSHDPKFDIEGWKLNEQMRKLWWESH